MSNEELIDYINNALTAGVSSEKIKTDLIVLGYKEEEVGPILNNSVANFEIKHEVNSQNYLNQKKDFSPLYYSLGSIVLDVVGFGVCVSSLSYGGYAWTFSIIYLSAFFLALLGLIKINQVDKNNGLKRGILLRIVVIIMSIIFGGWGLFWGVWGLTGAY